MWGTRIEKFIPESCQTERNGVGTIRVRFNSTESRMNHATYLREKLEINLKNYTINFYTRREMLTLIKVEYRQGEGIFHRQPHNK